MRWIVMVFGLVLPLSGQGVFRVAMEAALADLDPILTTDLRVFRVAAQLFEAPLEIAMDEKDRCSVAPGITSLPRIAADGLGLEFAVAKGVRFADAPCFPGGKGREILGSDLVYSLLRVADPRWKSPFFESFLRGRIAGLDAWREAAERDGVADYDAPVEGLRADGKTVAIGLVSAYPQLLPLLTQPWASVVPREAVQKYGSGFGAHPVGSGPFVLVERDATGGLRLARNPNYRLAGKPAIEELRFDVVPEPAQRAARLLLGDLHSVDLWGFASDAFVDKKGAFKESVARQGFKLVNGPALTVSYLVFNFRNAALAKLPVRKAIALAIDRGAALKVVNPGRGIPAGSPIPPALADYAAINDQAYPYAVKDVAAARRFLAEAGHPGGEGLPEFVFDLINPRDVDREAARAMIRDLAAVGIRCQLREAPFERFVERARSGDFQIAWTSWYADYADVDNFLILFRSDTDSDFLANSNYGHYKNAEFDALYDEIAKSWPGKARQYAVGRAVEILRRELPWVFLEFIAPSSVVPKNVEGYRYNVLAFGLRDLRFVPR